MSKCFVYIHGKGGSADEAKHYQKLFCASDVIGFDYQVQTPWEAKDVFLNFFRNISKKYQHVSIIANSIGAFLAMHALKDFEIDEAFFISPIVNMEKLITDMMQWANISKEELQQKGTIQTEFGETLSWQYLEWVKAHPLEWKVLTQILYGQHDNLQSLKDIEDFCAQTGADVTVMENGEHWFHTEEQMRFLDEWIMKNKS